MSDTTTTSDPVPPPSLQDRIQTLTDVHHRLQTLRHVPSMLLRPPLADFPPPFDPAIDREFAATFNTTPGHDFRALKEFLEVLCSDKVQDALRAARASEEGDHSELGLSFRRENRKRKCVWSSISRQTYNLVAGTHNRQWALHNRTCRRRRDPRHCSRLPRTNHRRCELNLCSSLCASLTEVKRRPWRSGRGPRQTGTSSRGRRLPALWCSAL